MLRPVCRKKGKDRASEREIDRLARVCWKKKTHRWREKRLRSRRKTVGCNMLEREKDGIVTGRGFNCWSDTSTPCLCTTARATALNLTCTRRVTHAFPFLLLFLFSTLRRPFLLLHLRILVPLYGFPFYL